MRWQDRYSDLIQKRREEIEASTLIFTEVDIHTLTMTTLLSIDIRLQLLLEAQEKFIEEIRAIKSYGDMFK